MNDGIHTHTIGMLTYPVSGHGVRLTESIHCDLRASSDCLIDRINECIDCVSHRPLQHVRQGGEGCVLNTVIGQPLVYLIR